MAKMERSRRDRAVPAGDGADRATIGIEGLRAYAEKAAFVRGDASPGVSESGRRTDRLMQTLVPRDGPLRDRARRRRMQPWALPRLAAISRHSDTTAP
jgi:hypothetical protein